ncbi:MAG: hypothetical protein E7646_02575 [Ruminococcaceae bacterium]|nr:hypothetical protein [Oscillospiraceae bacterium]
MKINIIDNANTLHADVMKRAILKKIPAEFCDEGLKIELCVDGSIGVKDSYEIAGEGLGWKVSGSDVAGLYYGIGKLLHSAKWAEDSFAPCPPKGVRSPACSYRVIYFSVHNFNWFHTAKKEELEEYFEELVLWGYNGIHCIIPVMNLESFEDELLFDSVRKSRELFLMAKKFGMLTSFGVNPNQGIKSSPHEFDADPSFDPLGYIRGNAGRNLCPAIPGALEHLRQIWIRMYEQYKDIGLDFIQFWPYDEGGCGCEKCRPWGAKGYLDLCIKAREEALKFFPDVRFVVAAWIFDKPDDQGEYAGLYKRLKGDVSWADYIMVDAHDDFPKYPLENPVIKPVINFPEISMWKLYPWGGFGANPMPKRFQKIWDSSKKILGGGQPYSEGIYEDILKIQCVGYYWEPDRHYSDILKEYVNYEYSSLYQDEILKLMELIEENHVAVGYGGEPRLETALEAEKIARRIDKLLYKRNKEAWRWRILFIRAVLDAKRYSYYCNNSMSGAEANSELRHFAGVYLKDDPESQEMFLELRRLYHAVPYNKENQYTLPPYNGETWLGNGDTIEDVRKRKANKA